MDDEDFKELFKRLEGKSTAGTSWSDVGAEFQALGKTLGDVFRAAWQREDNQAGLRDLQQGLQALIDDANRAIEGTPEAQQTREQLLRVTESLRVAAERTTDELRPGLLALLRQANAELRKLTGVDE